MWFLDNFIAFLRRVDSKRSATSNMLRKSFHVNKAGEVGRCKAKIACPLMAEKEHLSSESDARRYYEDVMEGRTEGPLSWLLSDPEEPVTSTTDPAATVRELYEEYQQAMKPYGGSRSDLDWYKGFGYERVNTYLRAKTLRPIAPQWALEDRVQSLNGFIARHEESEPKARRVFRVVTTPDAKKYAQTILKEKVFEQPGFLSTSASPEFAGSIAAGNYEHWKGERVVFEIVARGGVSCQSYEAWDIENFGSKENEVLFGSGKKFAVVSAQERTIEMGSFLDHCEGDWKDSLNGSNEVKATVIQLVEI